MRQQGLKRRLDGVGIGIAGKTGIGAKGHTQLLDPAAQHVLERRRARACPGGVREDENVARLQSPGEFAKDGALAGAGSAGEAQSPGRAL